MPVPINPLIGVICRYSKNVRRIHIMIAMAVLIVYLNVQLSAAPPPRKNRAKATATDAPKDAAENEQKEKETGDAPKLKGNKRPGTTTKKKPKKKKDEHVIDLEAEKAKLLDYDTSLEPLGAAGDSPIVNPPKYGGRIWQTAVVLPDRWRIGWPEWDRYGRTQPSDAIFMSGTEGDGPYTRGHPVNPYDRNVLKGDYPILEDDLFFNLTFVSDTFFTFRRLPLPSGVSAANSAAFDFFGDGKQNFFAQNALLTFEMFQGYSAFRPVDWLVRITPAFNFNRLTLRENNAVDIDVREGDIRKDDFVTIQEGFLEVHLGDTSPHFDISAVRIGRQLFISDFRGFVFSDVSDGVRLLGNAASNQVQYNLAIFVENDKDTNSQLNELNWRDQQVLIANLFIQDFFWLGYTTQFSFHWNHDQSDLEFDDNGFLVIPDLAGSVTLHDIDAYYFGWTGDGHIGRLNVNHAFYYVTGEDDGNPIAGRSVDISAYMAALELSIDIDWFRPKVHVLYASGDDDPEDSTARGFDGIQDNPFFAGGPSSFYQSQALRLFGVNLVSDRSFFNDLAGTKAEGQSNFVNPGTLLLGAGFDAEITPKLRTSVNANSIWFDRTQTLELFLNQNDIDRHIGEEINLVAQYRPFLNNNIIITAGASVFFPGDGFEEVFQNDTTLYQGFTAFTVNY